VRTTSSEDRPSTAHPRRFAGVGEGAQFASLALTALAGAATPGASSPCNFGLNRPPNCRLGHGYATHAVAQMRRAVAQRGLDREPIEVLAEQRFPEIALETALEEVG